MRRCSWRQDLVDDRRDMPYTSPMTKQDATKKTGAKKPTPKAKSKKGKPAKRLPRKRATEIAQRLAAAIPEPEVELRFRNAFELLIATILAAQSQDKVINTITPALFEAYPDAAALSVADLADIEVLVRRSGYYRQKSKAIVGAAAILVEKFGGDVPKTIAELTQVPGVARKTANVVLGCAYGIATGIVVDTHVDRLTHLMRLSSEKNRDKLERDLMALFPQDSWIVVSHRLILHGRYICTAKSPSCMECPLNELCPGRQATPDDDDWTFRAAWERDQIPKFHQ